MKTSSNEKVNEIVQQRGVIVVVQLAVCVVFGRSQSVRANGRLARNASIATQLYLPYRYARLMCAFNL